MTNTGWIFKKTTSSASALCLAVLVLAACSPESGTTADASGGAGAPADALLVVTEWKEFRTPDFEAIRDRLKQPVVFDGRNIWDPAFARSLC